MFKDRYTVSLPGSAYWNEYGRQQIEKAINLQTFNQNVAKNVIVFIGDGFDITTNTAARILKEQLAGATGEEAAMIWDEFPHVSLSKVGMFNPSDCYRFFFKSSKLLV